MAQDDQIRASILKAWQCALGNVQEFNFKGAEVAYSPLFFQENPILQPSEVDSCATAIGISTLCAKTSALTTEEKEILRKCCRFLIMMQEPLGGWPSIIPLKGMKIQKMEGTINDTVFALKALLDFGLPSFLKDVSDLPVSDQLRILFDGIKWLLANRIHGAWYYIEKEFILSESAGSITPMTLTTSNVLLLLSQARKTLVAFKEELKRHTTAAYSRQYDNINNLIKEIDLAYAEAIEWLRTIQNKDGGYGKHNGDDSRITNTALVLRGLLTDDSEESIKKARDALRMLLKSKTKRLQSLPDKDIFESYDQIWVCEGDGNITQVRRLIVHEKYAVGLLLQVLTEAVKKKWKVGKRERTLVDSLSLFERNKHRKLLNWCADGLIGRQESAGRLVGAFKGYRHTPLAYPVYAVQDSISGLYNLLNNTKFRLLGLKDALIGLAIVVVSGLVIFGASIRFGFPIWQAVLGEVVVLVGAYGIQRLVRAFQ